MNAFVLVNVLCLFGAGLVYCTPTMVMQATESNVQESYSASSSSYSSTSMSSTSSSINNALFQQAFAAAGISSVEAQLYMQYLSQLPSNQIQFFEQIVGFYSSTTFDIGDMLLDYNAFSSEISTLYNAFSTQSLYVSGVDWASQTSFLQQYQSSFSNLLAYTTQGSSLYELINFANQNVLYAPLVAGCLNYLTTVQGQYYTATTASTTTSSSSYTSTSATSSGISTTSSSINTSLFQQAFTTAGISSAEAQLYLQYLSQLPSNQIQFFEQIVGFYSSTTFDIGDMLLDYSAFSSEISTLYNAFSTQSLYVSGVDWASQTSFLQQYQSSFSNLLAYTNQGSSLYELINFANQNVLYAPLVAGCLNYLTTLQGQYYTATTASATTSSSSYTSTSATSSGISTTSSSINTSLFQQAFTTAGISSAEAQLYLQYLSQLPSNQIQFFEQIVGFYSSTTFDIGDMLLDYSAFSSEISTLYNAFSTQSLYVSGVDWASQTSFLQQYQSSFSNLLAYTTQGSSLYELINFANQNVLYAPLVAGCLNYLTTIQGQYYTSASSSSYTETSASSYSASSMSASSAGGSCLL